MPQRRQQEQRYAPAPAPTTNAWTDAPATHAIINYARDFPELPRGRQQAAPAATTAPAPRRTLLSTPAATTVPAPRRTLLPTPQAAPSPQQQFSDCFDAFAELASQVNMSEMLRAVNGLYQQLKTCHTSQSKFQTIYQFMRGVRSYNI